MKRLLAVLAGAALLAGCTSSGSKPATTSPPKSTAAATVAPDALKKDLGSLTSLTSARVLANTLVSGQKISGSGMVRLVDGAVLAGDLIQTLPGGLGAIHVIRIGGKSYAKLPPGLTTGTKPWLLLRTTSSNPVVMQLAAVVSTILAVASPSSLVSFANAATSITDRGGTPRHYSLKVDTAKLPPDLSAALGGSGSVPIELYLDAQNRPVQIAGTFSVAGTPVTPTITLSAFNEDVSISAPPAAEVATQ